MTRITTTNGIRHYEGDITPDGNVVFVFGSNPEGRHGAGAAKTAREQFGAVYGRGEGLQGNAYALPTKDLRVRENGGFRSISPDAITDSIRRLYDVARANPDRDFCIAYRNTDKPSLNGYTGIEMMRMFASAGPLPANIVISKEWADASAGLLVSETAAKGQNKAVQTPSDKKRSNLSSDLYRIVRAPEFIERHGDWRNGQSDLLLDENGEPRIVWHGSAADFKEFSLDHCGENTGLVEYTDKKSGETVTSDSTRALFFTDNRELAISYAFLARHNQIVHNETLLTEIRSILYDPKSASISHIRSRDDFNAAVRDLRKEDDAELNALLDRIPVLSETVSISGMDETERAKLAEDIIPIRNRYAAYSRLNCAGGLSNRLNNLTRQRDYLPYFKDNLDRLCENDKTVMTDLGMDFSKYNISFFAGKDKFGSGILIFSDNEDGRLKAAGFKDTPVRLDTLSQEERQELISCIEADLDAAIDEFNSEMRESGYEKASHLYPAFLKASNPLIHDYQGSSFPDKYIPDERYDTAYIAARQAARAVRDGNDMVVYRNIRDPFLGTTYGVFSTDRIVSIGPALMDREDMDIAIHHRRASSVVPPVPDRQTLKEKATQDVGKAQDAARPVPETIFREYTAGGYSARTYENARQADLTLAFATDFTTAGERCTANAAGKAYIPTILNGRPTEELTAQLVTDINMKSRILGIDKSNLRLNIAGNGIYTLIKSGYTQYDTDKLIAGLLSGIQDHDGIHISSIRSGGQTGVDEAGIKAGRALGLPTTVLAPRGWAFRVVDRNGNHRDIYDERAFKARFGVTVKETVRQAAVQNPSTPSKWTPVRGRDGRWNYRDSAGHLLAGTWLDKAEPFRNGKAVIERGGTRAEINEEGVVTTILAQKMSGPKL